MASTIKVDKLDPQSGTALEIGTSGDTVTVPSGVGLTLTDSTLLLPTTVTATTEVKTNKISPATGTAFAIGDSGDTFTVPSGATIVNSGTATGFGGGLVLQVLYDVMTAQQSTTSTTYADTDLSIAITPASSDNSILVICNIQMVVKQSGDTSTGLKILREATMIGGSSNNNSGSTADRRIGSSSFCILDAPSTTSEITYKVQIANQNNGVGTSYMNYSPGYAGASQLTLMEISG